MNIITDNQNIYYVFKFLHKLYHTKYIILQFGFVLCFVLFIVLPRFDSET